MLTEKLAQDVAAAVQTKTAINKKHILGGLAAGAGLAGLAPFVGADLGTIAGSQGMPDEQVQPMMDELDARSQNAQTAMDEIKRLRGKTGPLYDQNFEVGLLAKLKNDIDRAQSAKMKMAPYKDRY